MSREEEIQINTKLLWKLIEETLEYYNSISCPCAFPRYRQYVGIDCIDYHGSFYMSETEGFIHHSAKYFNIKDIPAVDNENTSRIWECRKCKTKFLFGWSDFSIAVNRSYLKLTDHKVEDIGSKPGLPTPFFVGLFGHKYPNKELFQQLAFDHFRDYLRSMS